MIFIIVLLSFLPTAFLQACTLRDNGYNNDQPIFLQSNFDYLYPDNPNRVVISSNDDAIVSCGLTNLFSGTGVDFVEETNTVVVHCEDSVLSIEGRPINPSTLICGETRFESVRPTGDRCTSGGVELEVGFLLNLEVDFVPLVKVCFDEDANIPYYIEFKVSKSVQYPRGILGYITDAIVDEQYYSIPVDLNKVIYDHQHQRETINGLIGLPTADEKYISLNRNPIYLFQMPLADGYSFYQFSQMYAVYRSVNSLPIWSSITNGNWVKSSQDLVNYIVEHQVDIVAYAGAVGISTLPHEVTNEEIELFLYVNGNVKTLPVPALLWKIFYEPETQQAVVLITVNNIYQVTPEQIICTDVTNNLGWLNWNRFNLRVGFSYACRYEDVVGKISDLPELEVTGLLIL